MVIYKHKIIHLIYMSLLKKLEDKKVEKAQQEKAKETAAQLRTLTEVDSSLTVAKNQRERIAQLNQKLEEDYKTAGKTLADFKGQKKVLQETYEGEAGENKKLWAEEGINSYEELLAKNAAEPEVRKFRQTGGRGPAQENSAVGETGRLYKEVGTITEVKAELKALMPELKLNFSGAPAEGEKMSNRDLVAANIENYLKNLDLKIETLEKERATAYLATPEGKREALAKELRLDRIFSQAELNRWNNFHFQDDVFMAAEKYGAATVKEILSEKLEAQLIDKAWQRKNSDEKEAVENFPALDKLDKTHYDWGEFREVKDLYSKALRHLSDIIEGDQAVANKFSHHGFSGASPSETKYRGWDNGMVKADRFFLYACRYGRVAQSDRYEGFNDFGQFSETFNHDTERLNNKNFYNNSSSSDVPYSPEYYTAALRNYRAFFERILTTDVKTEFFDPSGPARHDKENIPNLVDDLNRPEFRQEIGLQNMADIKEKRLSAPVDYINSVSRGNFPDALKAAAKINEKWTEDKKKIKGAAGLAVDMRWDEVYGAYYQKANKKTLDEISADRGLAFSLGEIAQHIRVKPEYMDRLVKLEGEKVWLRDVTGEKEAVATAKEMADFELRRNAYIAECVVSIKAELSKLDGFLVLNKKDKKKPWEKKLGLYEHSDPVYGHYNGPERLRKDYDLSETEITRLKELHDEYVQLSKRQRQEEDSAREIKNYTGYIRANNINPAEDIYNHEMSFRDLNVLVEQRRTELKNYLDNLPPEVAVIEQEAKRAKKATDTAGSNYEYKFRSFQI